MKLLLPSHGLLGQRWVSVRQATMQTLHELQQYNQDEFLRKYFLVESLTDANLDKITENDLEFLATFLIFAMLLNRVKFPVKCSKCGKDYDHFLKIEDLDVIELSEKSKPKITRFYKLHKYDFKVLSAKEAHDAYMHSLYEDDMEDALRSYRVCKVLGKPLNREVAEKLPMNIYLSALAFSRYRYHGFSSKVKTVCTECGNESSFNFKLSESSMKIDTKTFVSKFLAVASMLTFDDFLKFTITDYNSLIEVINERS